MVGLAAQRSMVCVLFFVCVPVGVCSCVGERQCLCNCLVDYLLMWEWVFLEAELLDFVR